MRKLYVEVPTCFLDEMLTGLLRNSSRVSGANQMRAEYVYFMMKSDKISTSVPDSFSRDRRCFEFRNGPLTCARRQAAPISCVLSLMALSMDTYLRRAMMQNHRGWNSELRSTAPYYVCRIGIRSHQVGNATDRGPFDLGRSSREYRRALRS